MPGQRHRRQANAAVSIWRRKWCRFCRIIRKQQFGRCLSRWLYPVFRRATSKETQGIRQNCQSGSRSWRKADCCRLRLTHSQIEVESIPYTPGHSAHRGACIREGCVVLLTCRLRRCFCCRQRQRSDCSADWWVYARAAPFAVRKDRGESRIEIVGTGAIRPRKIPH